MKRAVVVYRSHSGVTRRYGEAIGRYLEGLGIVTSVASVGDCDFASVGGADYLLLGDDETRQGALRFAAQEGGPFLRGVADHRTPPLIELPALLAASEHVYDEVES